MANIWPTNNLLDSVALDAPKNDLETLIFQKCKRNKNKKRVCP